MSINPYDLPAIRRAARRESKMSEPRWDIGGLRLPAGINNSRSAECSGCTEKAQRIVKLELTLKNTWLNLGRIAYYNPEEDQLNIDLIVAEIRCALEGK